jgi:hypothetical protein
MACQFVGITDRRELTAARDDVEREEKSALDWKGLEMAVVLIKWRLQQP